MQIGNGGVGRWQSSCCFCGDAKLTVQVARWLEPAGLQGAVAGLLAAASRLQQCSSLSQTASRLA